AHEARAAVVLAAFGGDDRVGNADFAEGGVPVARQLFGVGVGMCIVDNVRSLDWIAGNLAQVVAPIHASHQYQVGRAGIAHGIDEGLYADTIEGQGRRAVATLRIVCVGDGAVGKPAGPTGRMRLVEQFKEDIRVR